MEYWILFGTFAALLVIGTPIAFCLGVASFATILYLGLPPLVVFQRLASGVSIFVLMAIPFFIYAGDLMVRGGIASRLVNFAGALVGHLRGGLGQVGIIASIMFGGISGSAVADASAIGGLMVPQMEKRGYGADYAVNVIVTASIIALMIPPSHNMIIYSISAGGRLSIADLFTAGILPGLLLAIGLMVAAYFVARHRGYATETFPGWGAVGALAIAAIPGFLLILIIFGGVRSGIFTATESSDIAIVYAIFVTAVVYRSLSWKEFVAATMGAVRTTAMVLLIVGAAAAFGWLMAYLRVPATMIAFMKSLSDDPIVIMLLVNVLLLFLGAFMDMGTAHHHHDTGLSAGRPGLWRRPNPFRRHFGAESRHRPGHTARWCGAVRRLCGGKNTCLAVDQEHLALLHGHDHRLDARHLHSRNLALAAIRLPVTAF